MQIRISNNRFQKRVWRVISIFHKNAHRIRGFVRFYYLVCFFSACRLWDVLESSFTTRVPDRHSQTDTNSGGRKGRKCGRKNESDGGNCEGGAKKI